MRLSAVGQAAQFFLRVAVPACGLSAGRGMALGALAEPPLCSAPVAALPGALDQEGPLQAP